MADINEHDVRKAYARMAPVYDFTFGLLLTRARARLLKYISSLPPSRILEVGVGTGIALPHYKREHRITGIDLSPDMLEKARQRVAREGLTHVEDIVEMDAGNTTFDDESFDVVVAMNVLPTVPDATAVMHEMARLCKTGGEVILMNHFTTEKGLRGKVERAMANLSEHLGWRPDFPREAVFVCDDLKLEEERPVDALRLFTMMRFRKVPGQAASSDEGKPLNTAADEQDKG